MDDEAGRALFYILVEAEGGSAGKPLILWTNVRHSAERRCLLAYALRVACSDQAAD